MGPEAVPRQILREELSGTLVKPSKTKGDGTRSETRPM